MSARPLITRSQFIRPKELSKIHHQITTATTSGTAQGSAIRRRAMVRPLKCSLTRRAVAMPMTKQAVVTVRISLIDTQQLCQNSADVKSFS